MRKIKSVKLKNEYRDNIFTLPSDQYGIKKFLSFDTPIWEFKNILGSIFTFSESSILENKTDLFEIEYEEERKYIDVRIEYDSDTSNTSLPLTANNLETHFDIATELKNAKVTELPETQGWTDEDMLDFVNYDYENTFDSKKLNLEKFKAERKSK